MTTTCPACQGPRTTGKYLCHSCWFQLHPTTRRHLSARDHRAVRRLQSLLDQIRAGTPLASIRVE